MARTRNPFLLALSGTLMVLMAGCGSSGGEHRSALVSQREAEWEQLGQQTGMLTPAYLQPREPRSEPSALTPKVGPRRRVSDIRVLP